MHHNKQFSGLEHLSRLELAALLSSNPSGSRLWQQVRAECSRRAQRWDAVAGRALLVILASLALIQALLIFKAVL